MSNVCAHFIAVIVLPLLVRQLVVFRVGVEGDLEHAEGLLGDTGHSAQRGAELTQVHALLQIQLEFVAHGPGRAVPPPDVHDVSGGSVGLLELLGNLEQLDSDLTVVCGARWRGNELV